MAGKYYAVKTGVVPGIYLDWDSCKRMVDGYPKAEYKSFRTVEEAREYLEGNVEHSNLSETNETEATEAEPYAFVDGSFNAVTGVYGFGGFLCCDGQKHVLQGSGIDEEMAAMRNVAGEILGCQAAVGKAIELGLSQLVVYYDYMGIEMWATGQWKRNKTGTIAYHEYMESVKNKIRIDFRKVKGHSGVEGNEEADRLAKEAVGILD